MGKGGALTWRVVLAIVFGVLVFQPAAIWLNLVTGLSPWTIINAAEYTTLFFFVTIAVIMGAKLTRQEAFILFSNVGTTVSESLFAIGLINAWYIASVSEYVRAYGLYGELPFWYAPVDPYIHRTLFQQAFIPPLMVAIISSLFTKTMDLSFAYVLYRIYFVEEKLPFPGARVWAESSIVLAEKHVWRDKARLMIMVAVFAFLYSIPLYGLRFALGVELIPVPWIDFTQHLERAGLKGASLGLSLDLLLISVGMIMPWKVNVSIFIGGLAYLVFLPIAVDKKIFTLWRPGLDLGEIYQYSLLQLFIGPLVGLSLAAGVAPMIVNWRSVARVFRPPKAHGVAKTHEPSLFGIPLTRLTLMLFLASSIGLSVFAYYLIMVVEPEHAQLRFLILFALLITGFSALFQIANTRAIGESSMGLNIPYVREAALLGSGYRGVAAWFTPLYVYGGASGWTAVYAACDWTGTSKGDYIKAYLIAFPLTYLMSVVYADIFWRMAPIPSAYYPATAIFWRVSAMWALLWPAWSTGRLRLGGDEYSRSLLENFAKWPTRVLAPFIAGSAVVVLTKVFSVPFELVGFTIGLSQPIAYTMSMFIGGVIARILERRKGYEWFREYIAVISAGLGLGEGLLVALSISVPLVTKSMWPYAY